MIYEVIKYFQCLLELPSWGFSDLQIHANFLKKLERVKMKNSAFVLINIGNDHHQPSIKTICHFSILMTIVFFVCNVAKLVSSIFNVTIIFSFNIATGLLRTSS